MSPRPGRQTLAGRRASGREARGAGGGTSAPRTGYVLTVVDGAHAGKEYFFEHSATVGRVESNDLVLVEPGISRSHARIVEEHGILLLQDLGSANGTRLNGQTIGEPEVLKDGDYISLGATTLQFSPLSAPRGDVTSRTSISDLEALAEDIAPTRVGRFKLPLLRQLRRPRVLLLLLLALALAGGLGWWLLRSGGGALVQRDQSKVPLDYSDEDEFFTAIYGLGRYDRIHPNELRVRFEYLGGRATLQYGAWGVDKVDEVVIRLNGKAVGSVPLTMGRWVYGLKLELPQTQLKRSGINELVFDNTQNPPGDDPWEICYLQILQQALPPADLAQARAQFALARKSWEGKEIEPGNLYKALEGFRRARDLMERLPDRPPLYQDAVDFIDRVDRNLTRRFSEALFSAKRALKLDNDPQTARSILLKALRYFQKDDFRHREIQRHLDALAQP